MQYAYYLHQLWDNIPIQRMLSYYNKNILHTQKKPRNFFSKINSINSSVIKSAYNAWERNVNENGFHGEWVVLDLIKMMLVLLKGNKWQSNRPPNRLNARQGWFRDKVEEIFDRRMVINE